MNDLRIDFRCYRTKVKMGNISGETVSPFELLGRGSLLDECFVRK